VEIAGRKRMTSRQKFAVPEILSWLLLGDQRLTNPNAWAATKLAMALASQPV
jgi:hypothetical protein